MATTLDRRDVAKNLDRVLDSPIELDSDREMAIRNLLSAAKELTVGRPAPSYIDEKMSKAVRDTCQVFKDYSRSPSMCEDGALDWANEETRARLGW